MRRIIVVIALAISALGAVLSGVKYVNAGEEVWTWIAFTCAGILSLSALKVGRSNLRDEPDVYDQVQK